MLSWAIAAELVNNDWSTNTMANRPKPLALQILDGFGLGVERDNNAIALANSPYRDSLQQEYPLTALDCSGDVLDLPADQMSNSEARHLYISGGRLVRQALSRVSFEIVARLFFRNPALCHTMNLVPLMHVGDSKPLQDGGNLADLAPTMRVVLGVQQSVEMTGRSLIG